MLLDNKRWVVFFSHTGTEILNISRALNRKPDRIVTNRPPGDPGINKNLLKLTDITYTSDRPGEDDYKRLIKDDDAIVTLHGWMRIVPPKICKQFNIVNLHPGLITKYPDLKGADPQKRASNPFSVVTYERVGCVIHRVVAQVDSGEILAECSKHNDYACEGELTRDLHSMSQDLWLHFLRDHSYNDV